MVVRYWRKHGSTAVEGRRSHDGIFPLTVVAHSDPELLHSVVEECLEEHLWGNMKSIAEFPNVVLVHLTSSGEDL